MTMQVRSGSSVVADSAASAGWTLVSRGSGFLRVILIGAVLGPSYFGNLFQLANQLPWIVLEVVIGALLGALLIPALTRHISKGDAAATERVAGGFVGVLLLGFSAMAVLVALAAKPIATVFALPIADPEIKQQFIAAAIPLLWLTAPQLVGYGIAITGQSVQQATGHFALPAAASIIENVVVVATVVVFQVVYGTGVALSGIHNGHLLLLGGGSTLGVALHASLQWWGVRRLGLRPGIRAGWRDPDVRAILKQAVPSSGTAVLNGVRFLVLLVAANTVAGGVVAFQLALNVLNLPVALGSKPVAYALLPRLSRFHQNNLIADFSDAYRRGVGLASLVSIPAAIAAVALGWFAAAGIAVGEMDTAHGRALLSYALVGVAGAVLGEGMQQLSTAASYARSDPKSPLLSLVIRLGVTAAGVAASLATLQGAQQVFGIAVSMSVGDLVAAAFLHRRVSIGLVAVSYQLRRSLNLTSIAAIATFGAAGVVVLLIRSAGAASTPQATLGFTVTTVGLAMLAFIALRSRFDDELQLLLADLRGGGSP